MPDDVPAALPLIALIAGLACGAMLVNAPIAVAALLVCALLSRKSAFVFAALGIVIAVHQLNVRAAEDRALAGLDAAEFVIVDAPLDRDWTSHPPMHTLRVRRFEANGIAVDRPLALHVYFDPPPIAMRTTIHAEGLLHANDQGDLVLHVKSPRLMRYSGTLSRLDPERWNRAAAMRIEQLPYPNEVALAEALALGRGERLDREQRDDFRRGGTYHLLVFSGMQIALAASLVLLWRRRSSDALLVVFAVLAPLFIGPTASVSRASLGIGLFAFSRLLKRPTSLPNLWCVAALIRLIAVPADLTDAGFQLTFAGAGALIFIANPFFSRRWLIYAAAAELTLTPLTLFHFRQYALGGSIATVVLTPLISAMLVVSIAACVVPCAQLMLAIRWLNDACGAINDVSANVSGIFTAPPLASMVIGFGAALLALAFTKRRVRATLMAFAVAIPTIAAVMQKHPTTPRMIAFDVGQGTPSRSRTAITRSSSTADPPARASCRSSLTMASASSTRSSSRTRIPIIAADCRRSSTAYTSVSSGSRRAASPAIARNDCFPRRFRFTSCAIARRSTSARFASKYTHCLARFAARRRTTPRSFCACRSSGRRSCSRATSSAKRKHGSPTGTFTPAS